jgi:preprotein translocase subunit YajC
MKNNKNVYGSTVCFMVALSVQFSVQLIGMNAVSLTAFSASALAEDEVSAPAVVAPAQPAQAVVSTTGAASTDAAAAPQMAPQQGSMLGMALPFVIMLTVMYFLMIRPQQKRLKEHQSVLSNLKNGDEVVTNAGILGTIAGMSDKVVTLEVAKNVQMKFLKSQVNQVVKGSIPEITQH